MCMIVMKFANDLIFQRSRLNYMIKEKLVSGFN